MYPTAEPYPAEPYREPYREPYPPAESFAPAERLTPVEAFTPPQAFASPRTFPPWGPSTPHEPFPSRGAYPPPESFPPREPFASREPFAPRESFPAPEMFVPPQRGTWPDEPAAPRHWPDPEEGAPTPPAEEAVPLRRQPARLRLVSRKAVAIALLAVVAIGAAVTMSLWWRDTGPGSIRTVGDLLTAGGRVTGLLGTYLLLIEVALMARIPWLEREVGSDWMTVAHRALGEYLVILLVGHAGLITVGYALNAQTGVVPQAQTLVLTYPDVLMATLALGLLVMVGVVSARAVRRRMAYETWHFVHLYVYLALALAFAHQFAVGAEFTANRPARIAWSAAHAAVAAAVLTFRVGQPMLLAYRHRWRVAAVVPQGPETVSIYVTGRDLNRLRAQAGQFFRWRFLTRGRWWQAHPFSLSAVPDGRHLRLTVKVLGDYTASLATLKPGTRVLAEGPYGAFTAARRTRKRVLLLGGGVGITPLRALFESLPGRPSDVVLAYRASTPQEVLFAEELHRIAAARHSALHLLLGARGDDRRTDPMSAEELRARVPDLRRRDVFVCGPPGMIAAARDALRRAGVPPRRIHVESFEM